MRAIVDPDYGWQKHPAVAMWRNDLPWLFKYMEAICAEWNSRGFDDSMLSRVRHEVDIPPVDTQFPSWIDSRLIFTHRANLYTKKPNYYPESWSAYTLTLPYDVCCLGCIYYWPTHDTESK
jgi:hypothetical protein